MDLAEWVTEGRYVGLLELIDELPSACRMKRAIAQDEEVAEYLLTLPESGAEGEPWAPDAAEFNLTNTLLASVIDELKTLRQSGIAIAGQKPRAEKPFPRPRTAMDRIQERIENEWVEDTLVKFGFAPDGS